MIVNPRNPRVTGMIIFFQSTTKYQVENIAVIKKFQGSENIKEPVVAAMEADQI